MLYGMEMLNNEWKLVMYKSSDYLVYSPNSRMYPKIPAIYFKERLKLFGATGDYFYYVFSFQERPRFIFVSKEPVNFSSVDSSGNRQDGKIALIVEGALYDIRTERFITFESNKIFFKFVLYDSGVPHVIYKEEDASYIIYTLSSRRAFKPKYKKVMEYEDPQFVSYIYNDSETLEPNLMRVVFYKSPNGKDNMIVLSDEIVCRMSAKNVLFFDTIPSKGIITSDEEYYKVAHSNEDVGNCLINEYGYFENNHVVTGDAIVVKVYEGEWEEYAFVRLDNGKVEFDCKATFFSFIKIEGCYSNFTGHNLIEITWIKNDFENESAVMDFTSNKLYSKNEFEKETTSA